MGNRRRAREFAIQVLFHLEFSQDSPKVAFDLVSGNFTFPRSGRDFSVQLVEGVCEKKEYLDGLISSASKNWKMFRMPRLERCILRLAVYEIQFMKEIPPKVSIDEAVELGKKFGSEESGNFINGVLDNIYNAMIRDGKISEFTFEKNP